MAKMSTAVENISPPAEERWKDRSQAEEMSPDRSKLGEWSPEAGWWFTATDRWSSLPAEENRSKMEASGSGSIKNDDMDNNNDDNNNNKDLVGIEYNSNNVKKARLLSTLSALLDDPILADVPRKPSLSDVDTLISLELGSAMRISILKLDGSSLDVVVMDTATVKDLKESINKKINETEQSKMGHRHISWRHVWSNFCLSYHNDKLLNDNTALEDYGVRNNSQVQFVHHIISRDSRKHSKRRKHRFFHGLNRKT